MSKRIDDMLAKFTADADKKCAHLTIRKDDPRFAQFDKAGRHFEKMLVLINDAVSVVLQAQYGNPASMRPGGVIEVNSLEDLARILGGGAPRGAMTEIRICPDCAEKLGEFMRDMVSAWDDMQAIAKGEKPINSADVKHGV